MKKQSNHIRVRPHSKKMWGEYCRALGTTSPDLFDKVLTSKQIKLNQRMLEELKKKEEDLRNKLIFKNDFRKIKKR